MAGIDLRIVKVTIQVNNGFRTFSDVAITANGTKYANALQNECEITLANLDRATQDYILTQTTPFNFNRTPKTVLVEAGRASYGTSKIYVGNIVSSSLSQPPDVTITLKCLTGNFLKGNIISRNMPGLVPLSTLSQQVASDTGSILQFQATDRNLSNPSFSGAALNMVGHLGTMGGLNVFIDDNTLVVKDAGVPIHINGTLRVLNEYTGMIGIPEFTEQGIRVKFLIDNKITLGGALQIESENNPATNGIYVVYKLGFQITNRDDPFYYVAEGARLP